MKHGFYKSPIGMIKIEAEGEFITSVSFYEDNEVDVEVSNTIVEQCKEQLDEYFLGNRKEFQLKIKFIKGTEFQRKVWKALMEIPYGETWCYKDIAEKISNPKAVRAVGGANNKNPIEIIIPCHRVIGKNGSLIGYARGIDKKEYLLELEKKKS